MKIAAFLLLIAVNTGLAQPKLDSIAIVGQIHSIVSDQPDKNYDFVVDVTKDKSFIYQYRGDELARVFELEDQITNLFVVSDGLMYVTLDRTDRLLIIDFNSEESIHSVDKRYSILHATDKYLFASKSYADFGNTERYYRETGLAVLNRQTYEEVKFMPATFIAGGSDKLILIKEIVNWGKNTELSKIYTLDPNSLKKQDFLTQVAGIAPETFISISPNNQFVSYSDGTYLNFVDVEADKVVTTKESNARRVGFISNSQFYLLQSRGGKYYIQLFDISNTEGERFEIDDRVLLNRGRVRVHCSNESLLVFSSKSNIVQRIKF
jgi:hypothetical protein